MKYIVAALVAVSLGGCASTSGGPNNTAVQLSHPAMSLPGYMPGTVTDPDFMRSVRQGG